ncbi:MAG: histidine kinase [Draconibacterium sp.]|nr:histidine kinase [Draconibacterium sp.]
MPQRILYNRFKIAGHLIFWLCSITLFTLVFYFYEEQIDLNLIEKVFVTNIVFAIGVYINLYFLIPKFLKRKSYIFYIFWFIVLLTLTSLLIQFTFIYPLHNLFETSGQFTSFNSNLHSAFFFATLVYIVITSLLKFIKEWLAMQDLNLKLATSERQKLEAELKSLKGQLNPHFLFNSLNNIYSLALIKSDKVPELILKLSDLMRHIIYETKENYISLEKEIEFADNFIALQKIRIADESKIKYSIDGDIPSGKIAPLLFEPFIDNAFKHGLPGTDKSDFISIKFDFTEISYLYFILENNFEDLGFTNNKNSGIGIENVKQRLKFLYAQNEYELTIKKETQIFSVSLKLKIK